MIFKNKNLLILYLQNKSLKVFLITYVIRKLILLRCLLLKTNMLFSNELALLDNISYNADDS